MVGFVEKPVKGYASGGGVEFDYQRVGNELKELLNKYINPYLESNGIDINVDDEEKWIKQARQSVKETLDKVKTDPENLTLREALIVSFKAKGVSIENNDIKFVEDGKDDPIYRKVYTLFSEIFPSKRNVMVDGKLAAGLSPNQKTWNSTIAAGETLLKKELVSGNTFDEVLDNNNFFDIQSDMSKDSAKYFGEGEKKSPSKTFWNYFVGSLKNSSEESSRHLIRDVTELIRSQSRLTSEKAIENPLTIDQFKKLTSSIFQGLNDYASSAHGFTKDKFDRIKKAIFINSFIPLRPTHLLDIQSQRPRKNNKFVATSKPYLNHDFTRIIFPKQKGQKKQSSIPLTASQSNYFISLSHDENGKRLTGKVFKNVKTKDITNVLKKVSENISSDPEINELFEFIGRETDDSQVMRKLSAASLVGSIDIKDNTGKVLSQKEAATQLLSHAKKGVSQAERAYITNLDKINLKEAFETFENAVAQELGLVDDKTDLSKSLGVNFPISDNIAKNVEEIVDVNERSIVSGSTPQYREPDIAETRKRPLPISGDEKPRIDLTTSDGKIIAADSLNTIDKQLNLLKEISPNLDLDDVDQRDLSRQFIANFKDSAEMMEWIKKNVDNFDGILNTNTGILEDLRDKARVYAQKSLHKHGISKNTLDFLEGITKKIPKSSIIGGPIGLGIELALDPTSVARADLPLPERPTVDQFLTKSRSPELFQQDIKDFPPRDEEGYLAELQNIVSQRPLEERETALFEGLQDKYIKPDEARIDTGAVSQWRNIAETEPTYQEGEHRYTEEDYSSLEDERIRSIKDIEAADLKREDTDYQDQMSTLMGEI